MMELHLHKVKRWILKSDLISYVTIHKFFLYDRRWLSGIGEYFSVIA